MIVIVAVDDRGGMMFNHRRQSQDRILRERVLALSADSKLWMNHYSEKQFDNAADYPQINVSDDFLSEAGPGEYCFVETEPVAPYLKWIEGLIIYRWNRRYPGDQKFDLLLDGWCLKSTTDFPGSSHEKLTEEVYGK